MSLLEFNRAQLEKKRILALFELLELTNIKLPVFEPSVISWKTSISCSFYVLLNAANPLLSREFLLFPWDLLSWLKRFGPAVTSASRAFWIESCELEAGIELNENTKDY